jgi:hypothetical protein
MQPSDGPVVYNLNLNVTINYVTNNTDHSLTSNTLNQSTVNKNSASANVDSSNDSDDNGGDVNAGAEPEGTRARRKRSVAAAIDNSPQVDEDTKPAVVSTKIVKKNAAACLVVIAGPHTGEEYFLGKGASKKMTIGTNPSRDTRDPAFVHLPRDENMEEKHASLEFVGNKHCLKINVTNIKSKGHTLINHDPVAKNRVAFAESTITIGDTVMRVKSVSS